MDPLQIAGQVTAWVGATGAAGLALRWMWRASKTIHRIADALLGDKDNGKPGLDDRLDRIDGRLVAFDVRLGAVESQVNPNGGKSMHDKVNQIHHETVGGSP